MYTKLPTWSAACLSLSILPTVSAFYPYHFPGSDDGNTARRRESIPQTARNSLTLPIRRVQIPRDNAYNIVNSKDPSQKNSVAIDQDGSDLSYMVAVTIGDSKEEYHLLLDSAASNTWVMGQDCATLACSTHNLFGKGDSSTLKVGTTPFDITYGTGTVTGTLATDTVHIGPLSPSIAFGLANNVTDEFHAYPMDGILGIGRGDDTQVSPQVVEVLATSNLIGAKLYGIHMSRSKDGLNDGELNFGEPNKARYDGNLNWLQTIPNDSGFWEIKIDAAGVDGNQLDFGEVTAVIDTGTSFVMMPENYAVTMHSAIDGTTKSGETFTVPCSTKETLFIDFGGKKYNISTADWVGPKQNDGSCRSNIIGRKTFGDTQWLVGDTFLKNVYSVFDFDNSQVGFGVKAAGSKENVPSASASPSAGAGSSANPTASNGGGPTPTGPAGSANPTSMAEVTQGVSGSSSPPGSAASGRVGASGSTFALMAALGLLSLLA